MASYLIRKACGLLTTADGSLQIQAYVELKVDMDTNRPVSADLEFATTLQGERLPIWELLVFQSFPSIKPEHVLHDA